MFRCPNPECDSDKFLIYDCTETNTVNASVMSNGDVYDTDTMDTDLEWSGNSLMECRSCCHSGSVKHFEIDGTDEKIDRMAKLLRLIEVEFGNYCCNECITDADLLESTPGFRSAIQDIDNLLEELDLKDQLNAE